MMITHLKYLSSTLIILVARVENVKITKIGDPCDLAEIHTYMEP